MEITNTRVIKLDTNDLLQYLEDKGYVLAELNLQNIELKEKVLCFTFSDSAIDATAIITTQEEFLGSGISHAELGKALYNSLLGANIRTYQDLFNYYTAPNPKKIRNVGYKSLKWIQAIFKKHHIEISIER